MGLQTKVYIPLSNVVAFPFVNFYCRLPGSRFAINGEYITVIPATQAQPQFAALPAAVLAGPVEDLFGVDHGHTIFAKLLSGCSNPIGREWLRVLGRSTWPRFCGHTWGVTSSPNRGPNHDVDRLGSTLLGRRSRRRHINRLPQDEDRRTSIKSDRRWTLLISTAFWLTTIGLMPTFIDESGETGHTRTSSPYFRLAAVWMPSLDEANEFRFAVRNLRVDRSDLRLEEGFEFKFARTHTGPERRRAFFDLALKFDFSFAVCSIDKTARYWRTASAEEQHWATATALSASLWSTYLKAELGKPDKPLRDPIWVDNNQDKRFLEAIRLAFHGLTSRLHPGIALVRNPRFRGSKADEVMHLVDMVCGAAGRFVDGDSEWFDLIAERCVDLTQLP